MTFEIFRSTKYLVLKIYKIIFTPLIRQKNEEDMGTTFKINGNFMKFIHT